jgi:hypothetical protein
MLLAIFAVELASKTLEQWFLDHFDMVGKRIPDLQDVQIQRVFTVFPQKRRDRELVVKRSIFR